MAGLISPTIFSQEIKVWNGGKAHCIAEIVNAPTVDAVEAVHGRWLTTHTVDTWMGISKIDGFICSECGVSSKRGGNYCPNCGARMDRGEDI